MKHISILAAFIIFSFTVLGCEKKPPTYRLRQGVEGDTVSHYDSQDEEVENERKFIKVRREEYQRERKLQEARFLEQHRRNKVYSPRR